jgi:di/tricarboxylate transporter
MTWEQAYVFAVLAGALGLFIWGRWRYDIVALAALLAVVAAGIVPATRAFEGFGHPAVITVAAVLVISRALQNSGMVDHIARWLERADFGPSTQVTVMAALVAALSGFMNNVGALALLMPVAIQAAGRSGRSPGELLMPLAFGSLLGGLVTLVGTPPNIIIAALRADATGTAFAMFDFTPVGLAVAIAGIAFIGVYGWRLIPVREGAADNDMAQVEGYTTEVVVPRKSGLSGTALEALVAHARAEEVGVRAVIRRGEVMNRPKLSETVRINDHLLLEGNAEAIKEILHATPLTLVGNRKLDVAELEDKDSAVVEAVVTPGSLLAGRSFSEMQVERRYGLHLLALARQGRPIREHLSEVRVRAGDVLLLQGAAGSVTDAIGAIGCLSLVERDITLHRDPTFMPLIVFALAIALGVTGLLSLPVAFTGAIVVLVVSGQLRARELYRDIDWPVVVLLGAMVPLGLAMEISGANDTLVELVANLARHLAPWAILSLVLVTTMLLSDVMNNAATAILMGQLAIKLAAQMQVDADPLLMAVAIGASSAYMTPIGHQSNILVMGPGGYRFGDYWRLGLPLSVLTVVVAVPLILWVWPL